MLIAHYTAPTLAKPTAWILKISPYRKSKKILTAATLADAIRGCDTYAQKEVLPGKVSRGLSRNANWRWEPASDNQKKFILKAWKGRKVTTTSDGQGRAIPATEEELRTMKKGEAANVITRLKHGALVGPNGLCNDWADLHDCLETLRKEEEGTSSIHSCRRERGSPES